MIAFIGWEVNPNLVLFRPQVSEIQIPGFDICLHRGEDEGVQRELVQGPVIARSIEQVFTELLRHSVTEHGVT